MNSIQSRSKFCAGLLRGVAHAGFTLVEMMVALVIASLLLVALTTLYVNNSYARIETDKVSRQIESGRFAMSELADDLRHAGYYGQLSNAPALPGGVVTLPDPCSQTLANFQNNLGLPVQGYAGAASAAALDAGKLACLDATAGYKPNTAVIVVRRADTSIAAAAPTAGFFNIQVSGCPGDPVAYVLDTDTNAAAYTLHTNTAVGSPSGTPGCLPITGAAAALITPIYTRIYFISTCSGTDCSAAGADNVPTLKRMDIVPTGTRPIKPIVDGIENMQFDYGVDTSSDGSPDVYKVPLVTAITEWTNVMSVRIHLLARNIDKSGGGFVDSKTYNIGSSAAYTPADSYHRHAYSELVRLVNPSARRE